jgi:hypothetical protein
MNIITIITSMISITIKILRKLSLIINQIIIIIDVYRHMLIMIKHHFTCD